MILGAGVTGLATGLASGLPVFEAEPEPGGICSSYYVRPGDVRRLSAAPADEEAYRFEIGGGHWIFGGDAAVLRFIETLTPVKHYRRASGVYLRDQNLYVPYPLQDHLRFLEPGIASRALTEMSRATGKAQTMKEWLQDHFGPTLCELFFDPFHRLYTAGLYERIAPQDPYKSPLSLPRAIRGAFAEAVPAGYNVTYIYPVEGLNTLCQRMAARCSVIYGKRVVAISPSRREVAFSDGSVAEYETLISTLPLNRTLEMAGLSVDEEPGPWTSVLVLNVGARRGSKCPEHHWVYVAESTSGFHRVGFYSNVDCSFLPKSARDNEDCVSLYVERAYPGGQKPDSAEVGRYAAAAIEELRDWGYIEGHEVVDPTWIDVGYTWSWPGSTWAPKALCRLQEHGIYPVGRYGRWTFQGIADSLRDGFFLGAAFRASGIEWWRP